MLKMIGKALALWALFAGCTACAEPTLALKLESESFVAGRPFDTTVFVKGVACSEPEWDGTGFSVMKRNSQVTGVGTNLTHAFSFRLVPLHAGKLVFPTFWAVCDEVELESEPKMITVQKPLESSDLTVSAALSTQEVFVGQPVRYSVEWRVGFDPVQLRAVRMVDPFENISSMRTFDVAPKGEKTLGLPVGNRRVMAAVIAEKVEDRTVTVHRFEQIVVPQESGEFAVPAFYMLCARLSGSTGAYGAVPSYFDNNFFAGLESRDEFVEYYAEAQPLKLTVKPLPVNDQSASFSGIVGACSLQAEVGATEVKVGDPLRLTLRVQTPFAQVVRLPDLRSFQELMRRFWIPETQSEGRVEKDVRVYEFSIRPLHTGVQMVPSIDLLIFNPVTEKYETVSTEAIALHVVANDGETRFVPPELDGEAAARERNAAGIWFNRELSAGFWGRLTAWSVAYWYVWFFVPVIGCFALEPVARFHRLKRIDPQQARALRAYPRFRRNEKRGKAVEILLLDYLAERFDLQNGTVTLNDMAAVFEKHGISDASGNLLIECMTQLDQEQFSPNAEKEDVRKRVIDIVRKLEGEVSR